MKIDFRSGKVSIVGPMTLEEKEELEYWHAQLPKLQDALADLRDALEMETDPDEIADLKDNIAQGEALCAQIGTALRTTSRLMMRYTKGENVDGFSVGLAVSF